MLTPEQEEFIREYILREGGASEAEHARARHIIGQIEFEEQAEPIRNALQELAPPDPATAAEAEEVTRVIAQGIDALAGELDAALIGAAQQSLETARARIAAIAERLERAREALRAAVATAQEAAADSRLSDPQSAALSALSEQLARKIGADFGNVDAVIDSLARVAARRDLILSVNKRIGDALSGLRDPEDMLEPERAAVETAREAMETARAAIVDEATGQAAQQKLEALEATLSRIREAVERRAELRRDLAGIVQALSVPDRASETERAAIQGFLDDAARIVAGSPDAEALQQACERGRQTQEAQAAARQRIERALATWTEALERIRGDVAAPGDLPFSAAQGAALETAIADVEGRLAPDLSNLDGVLLDFDAVRERHRAIVEAMRPLAARIEASRTLEGAPLAAETGRHATALKAARAAVEAVVDAATGSAAAKEVAALETACAEIRAAERVRAGIRPEVSAERFEAASTALGGPEVLGDILQAAGPGAAALLDETRLAPEALADVYTNTLGGNAGALAALFEIGCNRDPARLADLAAAFPDTTIAEDADFNPQENLRTLLATGGLGDHPEALGHLLATGCGGNPAVLAEFCKAFRADEDRAHLSGLLGAGGLGAAGAALGHVAAGAEGAKMVLELGAAFDTPEKLAKLDDLVTRGGLGGARGRGPEVLASVLADGVEKPADLADLHDAFGKDGMGDLRAMLAGLGSSPPGSEAGKRLAFVADRVTPPPEALKTVYFDTLDQGSQMHGADRAVAGVARAPQVAAVLDVVGKDASENAKKGVAATWGAASALAALKDLEPRDADAIDLLEAGLNAASTATVAAAGADALADDDQAGAAAEGAARRAATEGDAEPEPEQVTAQIEAAHAAAERARDAAQTAAQELQAAAPATADLLDRAARAAADAVAKAAGAVDDALRGETLAAARSCLDEIAAVTNALAAAASADAEIKSRATALQVSAAGRAAISDSAEKLGDKVAAAESAAKAPAMVAAAQQRIDNANRTIADGPANIAAAEQDLRDAQRQRPRLDANALKPFRRAVSKAKKKVKDARDEKLPRAQQALHDAQQEKLARDAAQATADLAYDQTVIDARNTAMKAQAEAVAAMAQAGIAKLIQDDPAILAAQAEAARLTALADRPEAGPADFLAAATAERDAAALLARAAADTAKAANDRLVIPDNDPTVILTQDLSSPDELIKAAIAIKTAMSCALLNQEKAVEAVRVQQGILAQAVAIAGRDGHTRDEDDRAEAAQKTLEDLQAEAEAAMELVRDQGAVAGNISLSMAANVKMRNKKIAQMPTNDAVETAARDAEQRAADALSDAAAMLVTVIGRCQSFGYPALGRDTLLATSATMEKADMSGLSDAEAMGDATVDMLHFCGRHTPKYFGFEGRDLADEDLVMEAAILAAQHEGRGGLSPGIRGTMETARQMKTTSMWPPDFDAADVRACLGLAIAEVERIMAADATVGLPPFSTLRAYLDLDDADKAHKGTSFQDVAITYNGADYEVAIGFSPGARDTDEYSVGQFYPSSTPSVPFADMHAMKKALKQ